MVYNTPKTSGKERGKHIYIHAFIFIFSQVTFDVELSVFCSLSLVHTYNQMHTAGKYWWKACEANASLLLSGWL